MSDSFPDSTSNSEGATHIADPGAGGPLNPTPQPKTADAPEIPDSRKNLVKEKIDMVKQAERYWKKAFDRMKECQQLAVDGAPKEWIESNSYVVPVIPRYINQAVASLYAKDPRVTATRRKKLMYQVWDEDPRSLAAAMQGLQMGDPNALMLVQELAAVAAYNAMVDKLGKTLEICWEYFCGAQAHGFKQELKSLIRRTRVNGVGYLKVGFQRALEPNPEITARIHDVTDKIARIEAQLREMAAGEMQDDASELEELRLSLADLQSQEMMIVREGPVFDYPRSTDIIPDPEVKHLKTWAGANWVAQKFKMTPKKVLEVYKVDLGDNYTKHYGIDTNGQKEGDETLCCLYEIHDKATQMEYTVCEGYEDFIKEPAKPDVFIANFWRIFPLVFNEVESDRDVFPPSDVWVIRHAQQEINRARQGVREHRMANRPKYVIARGALEETDLDKLESAQAHAVLELDGLRPEDDVAKRVQRFPNIGIDPNQYETATSYEDIERSVGAQQADIGGTSNNTATESSIAAGARTVGQASDIDDIDDFLSVLARAVGELMLLELSKETVVEIAGPGTSWPEMQPTREEVAKDLMLVVKAGSSGRPNKAAELANIERAVPYLLQLPGINPLPLAKKYADLLDIDIDELFIPNLPSVAAQNMMAGKQPQLGTGHPATDPNQQGPEGAQNAPAPQPHQGPGPQALHPAPHQATPQVA
jgi:hypothetical protein